MDKLGHRVRYCIVIRTSLRTMYMDILMTGYLWIGNPRSKERMKNCAYCRNGIALCMLKSTYVLYVGNET